MSTQRIITKATAFLREGHDPIEAIEAACDQVASTPAAREMARKLFIAAAAKVERAQPRLAVVR